MAWPVVEAPRFRNGQIATLVTGAASVGIALAIVYCSRRWPPAISKADLDLERESMAEGEKSTSKDEEAGVSVEGVAH